MVNIIFDGNYLFHKSLYVYSRADKGRMLDSDEDKAAFMKKCMTDFAFIVRKFKNKNKVIVTFDAYSWRKLVEIDENNGYKGNREKDESSVNWKAFEEVQNDFTEILQKKGVVVSKTKNAEGDDVMYFWTKKLLEKGENSILISGDRDISQLVLFKNNNFVVVYDPRSTKKVLFVPIGFKKWLKEDDKINFFDSTSFMFDSKSDLEKLTRECQIEEVDPKMVVFYKTICGDSGDNVPPVWSWQSTRKNGKIITNNVTPKKAKRIFEILSNKFSDFDVYNLQNYSEDITDNINVLYKQQANQKTVKDRLERNTKLVWLNNKVIPTYVWESFLEHYGEVKSCSAPSIKNYDMYHLLEDTKYHTEPQSFESDFFSKTQKNSKSLF